MTDYAHPMPPFEALPEPDNHPAPASWAPESLDVVSVLDRPTYRIYTLTNNHTVRESLKHQTMYCRHENNTTATCVFAVRRYLDRRAAA